MCTASTLGLVSCRWRWPLCKVPVPWPICTYGCGDHRLRHSHTGNRRHCCGISPVQKVQSHSSSFDMLMQDAVCLHCS